MEASLVKKITSFAAYTLQLEAGLLFIFLILIIYIYMILEIFIYNAAFKTGVY